MSQGKLVRDKIPEIIRASGEEPLTAVVGEGEFQERLLAKLNEEVDEFLDSDSDPHELADILEVVMALAEDIGIGWSGLEQLRAAKAAERGGFSQKIVWFGNRKVAVNMSVSHGSAFD